MIKETIEYKLISDIYENQVAKRSKVPLINHINEGIDLLDKYGADDFTKRAFCLHPIYQNIDCMRYNADKLLNIHSLISFYATEYATCANAYLCRPETDLWGLQEIGNAVGVLIRPVALMLRADKVQNQKDFNIYHQGSHVRSKQLEKYFALWLNYLDQIDNNYKTI